MDWTCGKLGRRRSGIRAGAKKAAREANGDSRGAWRRFGYIRKAAAFRAVRVRRPGGTR